MLSGCVAWPQELADRYRNAGYWRGEPLGELLRHWSHADGQRTALVTEDGRWSYSEIKSGRAWALYLADSSTGARVLLLAYSAMCLAYEGYGGCCDSPHRC